jgi:hypothetical protein
MKETIGFLEIRALGLQLRLVLLLRGQQQQHRLGQLQPVFPPLYDKQMDEGE